MINNFFGPLYIFQVIYLICLFFSRQWKWERKRFALLCLYKMFKIAIQWPWAWLVLCSLSSPDVEWIDQWNSNGSSQSGPQARACAGSVHSAPGVGNCAFLRGCGWSAKSQSWATVACLHAGKLHHKPFPVWVGIRLITDLVTSYIRSLSHDSACHKLWEVYPPILQLKKPQLGTIGRVGGNVQNE